MIRACWDIWCDVCHSPSQATAAGYRTRKLMQAGAVKRGYVRKKVGGRLLLIAAIGAVVLAVAR